VGGVPKNGTVHKGLSKTGARAGFILSIERSKPCMEKDEYCVLVLDAIIETTFALCAVSSV
jgi:hypothetical protein